MLNDRQSQAKLDPLPQPADLSKPLRLWPSSKPPYQPAPRAGHLQEEKRCALVSKCVDLISQDLDLSCRSPASLLGWQRPLNNS